MTIANASSTVNLVIDLQGYFTAAGKTGASFTPGTGRAYDSRATGNTILAKNETRSIQIAGKAGVPVMGSGITAVVLTLVVAHGGSDGRAAVWADGAAKPDTTSINFQADEIRTNTVTVPLGANGKISLNNVADATNYVIDVQGWYVSSKAPTITCAAPFTAGAWVSDSQLAADGVTCKFTAPAASSTGQELEVSANGLPEVSFPLSETGPASFSYTFTGLVGRVTLEASVNDPSTDTEVTTYQFGIGAWENEGTTPSLADGTVSDQEVTLMPFLASSILLPSDAAISYRLTDETLGTETTSTTENEPLAVGPDLLTRGHDYSWTATVRAANGWGTQANVGSPVWHFHVAADGEQITEPQPQAPAEGSFSAKAAPNGCTGVPDSYFKANFKPSCNKHDICYGKNSKTSRKNCDLALQRNLIGACTAAYGKTAATINGCYQMANNYYVGVRALGKDHYKGKGSRA
ncbi:phospholipase A2 [Sphingomonas sp. LR61]|uniref:phospholipase A2 n=1 Tax=Sphingomonas sp. LR61 TaxID=3050234 RepID=UPI002FE113DE